MLETLELQGSRNWSVTKQRTRRANLRLDESESYNAYYRSVCCGGFHYSIFPTPGVSSFSLLISSLLAVNLGVPITQDKLPVENFASRYGKCTRLQAGNFRVKFLVLYAFYGLCICELYSCMS
jgi:hypothetical protein